MVVYVEYVFIDNFVIDFLLFKTAFAVTGKTVPKIRIVLCSLLGAVFALIYPLITANPLVITAAKILFGLFLTFCAAKFNSAKDYAGFTAVFLGLTFLTGGAVIGAFYILGLDYSSEYSIALMALPVFIFTGAVVKVVRYLFRKKDAVAFSAVAEISFCGKTVKVNGFFDTGNALYNGLSPVIVVSKKAIMPIAGVALMKNAAFIRVKTVGGEDKKISFKPDAVSIYFNGERHIFNNVTVCVTDGTFNGYDAILHPALICEKENGDEREIVA